VRIIQILTINAFFAEGESEKFSISHGFGAIVHLLEDEFHEVRWSAIEVI